MDDWADYNRGWKEITAMRRLVDLVLVDWNYINYG